MHWLSGVGRFVDCNWAGTSRPANAGARRDGIVGISATGRHACCVRDDRWTLGSTTCEAFTTLRGAETAGVAYRRFKTLSQRRRGTDLRYSRWRAADRRNSYRLVPDYSFPKRFHMLRPPDFERVLAARRSATDKLVTVFGLANTCGHARLGLVASRRLGNAVVRNRWKRLLRESFRLTQDELPSLDLVCIPRAGNEPDLASLQKSLAKLAGQLARRGHPKGGPE